MKKKSLIKICALVFCLGIIGSSAKAQNDADPAVTSLSFANSPIFIPQPTTLTVFVTNGGFVSDIPAGSFALSISLPPAGEYTAFPESVAALSGSFFNKFTWTYNAGTKTFNGLSNQAIAAGDGGEVAVAIKGNVISAGAVSASNIILLSPASYPNDNPTNNDLTASVAVSSGVVAVNLLSFNAAGQNNEVDLSWITSSSVNNNYFDVQTSTDRITWNSIGNVQAAANSTSQQQYSFIHRTPAKGINYYRLKSVDLNGSFQYSLIRSVDFKAGNSITISPNPVKDRVYINAANSGSVKSVLLYSNEGKLLQSINNFVPGSAIDLENYTPGIYLLKVLYTDGKIQTEKVVRQ